MLRLQPCSRGWYWLHRKLQKINSRHVRKITRYVSFRGHEFATCALQDVPAQNLSDSKGRLRISSQLLHDLSVQVSSMHLNKDEQVSLRSAFGRWRSLGIVIAMQLCCFAAGASRPVAPSGAS